MGCVDLSTRGAIGRKVKVFVNKYCSDDVCIQWQQNKSFWLQLWPSGDDQSRLSSHKSRLTTHDSRLTTCDSLGRRMRRLPST